MRGRRRRWDTRIARRRRRRNGRSSTQWGRRHSADAQPGWCKCIADFQKGDAATIVATIGQSDSAAVAITVLGGVEPLLQASPQGQASILTPWTMSAGAGDAAAQ